KEFADLGQDWYLHALPPDGIGATLDAVGRFPPRQFGFRICQAPRFEVQLEGDGLLDDEDFDQSSWRVWKQEQLQIHFQLKVAGAPVCLDADVTVTADDPADD